MSDGYGLVCTLPLPVASDTHKTDPCSDIVPFRPIRRMLLFSQMWMNALIGMMQRMHNFYQLIWLGVLHPIVIHIMNNKVAMGIFGTQDLREIFVGIREMHKNLKLLLLNGKRERWVILAQDQFMSAFYSKLEKFSCIIRLSSVWVHFAQSKLQIQHVFMIK